MRIGGLLTLNELVYEMKSGGLEGTLSSWRERVVLSSLLYMAGSFVTVDNSAGIISNDDSILKALKKEERWLTVHVSDY